MFVQNVLLTIDCFVYYYNRFAGVEGVLYTKI